MADKFTISEVYENNTNRVHADESTPIKDDTLLLVSENDGGTYKTKALDYGTLYTSLCSSMDIQTIQQNITNITNNNDNLGISGDYPCFFEMYSSYHFNSLGTGDGIYANTWSGTNLSVRLGTDGTLDRRIQFDSSGNSTHPNQYSKTFLSTFTCLNPITVLESEHPDPQLVTVMMSSKQSGGVYFDHRVIDSSNNTNWQRMPIFTYNPDTANDYIATYKFIVTPGSRFGIFGKTGFFNDETNVVITLTNTKGHLIKSEYVMRITNGRYWSSEIEFKDITQPDGSITQYTPATYHLLGPITGTTTGGVICLMMKDSNSKWRAVATKQFGATNAKTTRYVDFGKIFIPKGAKFICWVSQPNLKTVGTSTIDGKSYINGRLYFEKSETEVSTIARPLKLVIRPDRTPPSTKTSNYSKNIQFNLNGTGETTNYIKVGGNVALSIMDSCDRDFRFYPPYPNNTTAVVSSEIELSVDCNGLDTTDPLRFYVASPTANDINEFKGGSTDGQYSGIETIDGSDDECNFTSLGQKFAYNCTNLTTASFNKNLTSVGVDSFNGCTSLQSVSMPGITNIGNNAFNGCTALGSFNVDGSGYSVMPPSGTVGSNAFNGSAIKKLSLVNHGQSTFGPDAFSKMKLTDCKIDFRDYSNRIAMNNTTIDNLSIRLATSYGSTSISCLPLIQKTCSVTNLSVIGTTTPTRPSLETHFNNFGISNLTLENITKLRVSSLITSETLQTLTLKNTNVSKTFCKDCKTVKTVSISGGTIDQQAFQGCIGLSTLTLSGVSSIGSSAFNGCTDIRNLSFSGSTTSIADSAFLNCTNITEIDLPTSITTLGKSAFKGCTNLSGSGADGRINLSNVTSFANGSVFEGTSIGKVLIGTGVTTGLNSNTFKDCNNLTRIYFNYTKTDDNLRTMYYILVGSKITKVNSTNTENGTAITSNVCNGCNNTVHVYYNCVDGFKDTNYKLAEINGNKITFKTKIPV